MRGTGGSDYDPPDEPKYASELTLARAAPASRFSRFVESSNGRTRASQMPTPPNLMPDLDQLLRALFLVALLLYLIPAVFGGSSAEGRRGQRAAGLTLGIATAIAVVASVTWFLR
jgi:hypothetical protein